MSRILILHWSHYGRTAAIAQLIAKQLRASHHQVDVVDGNVAPLPVPPDHYDAVVVGTRIELGRGARGLADYVREFRGELEQRVTGFYSVSMAASDLPVQGLGADAATYNATILASLAWEPTLRASFAGGLPYRRYGWILRHVMRAISRNAHHTTDIQRDHVFTDEAAVARFADRLGGLVTRDVERPVQQPHA